MLPLLEMPMWSATGSPTSVFWKVSNSTINEGVKGPFASQCPSRCPDHPRPCVSRFVQDKTHAISPPFIVPALIVKDKSNGASKFMGHSAQAAPRWLSAAFVNCRHPAGVSYAFMTRFH